MAESRYRRLGSMRAVAEFEEYLAELGLEIPCERELVSAPDSPLARPLTSGGFTIGNRFAIHPMEGWDATAEGSPGEFTFRRWRNFGRSGAKLIWGGEAAAVRHEGRANPNQLLVSKDTRDDLARLREALVEEHRRATGSDDGLVVGLQLTHSGRFSRPNAHARPEPRILYHHPILDRRLGIPADHPLLSDGEIRRVVEDFLRAAAIARETGFDFVDIKHCHGYLGHEFLSAHTREGDYGGSFENRTRFLREVVEGIRSAAPGLGVGVRVSAFDTVPFRPDPQASSGARVGRGVPEPHEDLIPYRWGFGLDPENPLEPDLAEPGRMLALLGEMGVRLVNITAGSPYYNPHIQRPALYAPSDGYGPPEDPLAGVARQMRAVRDLKRLFPDLILVGSAYTYLQEFLPNVAQAAVRAGWVDCVGLGRMVLSYPEMPRDVLEGRPLRRRLICRTFSDCTTAPRKGLPSGCYRLDAFYGRTEAAELLKTMRAEKRAQAR